MAQGTINIVKDITTNGTRTLATQGKYCENNIEINVNVPVPSGYIKPSGSKNITTNGTHDVTNYASAVVNVETAKPTQFTNLYDPANVTVKNKSLYSSSSGQQITSDNYVNYVVIPYHHKANTPVAIRVRGISIPVRDRQDFVMYNSDGKTAVTWGQLSSAITLTYDEYGDAVFTFSTSSSFCTREWYYLHLNFQYNGVNSNATAKTGPIITINEPIGNGGYVG